MKAAFGNRRLSGRVVIAIIGFIFCLMGITAMLVHVGRFRPEPTGAVAFTKTALKLPPKSDDALGWPTIDVMLWIPNGAPSDASSPAKVIVLLPGWGGALEQNSVTAQNLASHGYAAVAVADIADDVVERGFSTDDHAMARISFDITNDENYYRSVKIAKWRTTKQAQKVIAALDRLTMYERLNPRLDLSHVGVLGFSVGGSVATELTFLDQRFVAVVNYDGLTFGQAADHRIMTPYMVLNSTEPVISASGPNASNTVKKVSDELFIQDVELQRRQVADKNGYSFFIKHAWHEDFSDAAYDSSLKDWLLLRSGKRRQAHELADSYALAFFETFLSNRPHPIFTGGAVLSPDVSSYQELFMKPK